MGDDTNGTEEAAVHRLDTRQAEMSRDLRRLFEGVLDEPIPANLADLAAQLERKLADEDEVDPAIAGRGAEPG